MTDEELRHKAYEEQDEEYHRAMQHSLDMEAMYQKGWEDARQFYREELLSYSEGSLLKTDIEDIFNEYPEDADGILRQAALNRGQP